MNFFSGVVFREEMLLKSYDHVLRILVHVLKNVVQQHICALYVCLGFERASLRGKAPPQRPEEVQL